MTDSLHCRFINLGHFAIHYLLLIFPTAVLAIQKDWQTSYAQVLQLGTPALIVFGLATLPVGWLGDRLPRHWLMAAFFIGGGLAALATGFASGPVALAIGLAAIGLFAAIYHPVGLAMISDLAEAQGRALAVNGVWGNLGLAGATLATAFLAEQWGWRVAFLIPGAIILAIGLLYLGLCRRADLDKHRPERPASFLPLPRASQFRILLLVGVAALFGGFIFNGVTVTLPKVLEERLSEQGIALHLVGAGGALAFAIAAFSQLPVGAALDRFGAKPVLLILLSVQVAAMALMATAEGPIMLALAILLTTAIFAEIPVTSWLLARFVAPRWRSRAYSFEYVFSLGVSSAIIPLVAFLHGGAAGFRVMFLLLAGAALAVLAAALLLPRTGRSIGAGANRISA